MSNTPASLVVQTYLTFTAKRWGQLPSIVFTNGAIAGSEVVTIGANNTINVQIQDGVTTMFQIRTAIQNHVVTSGFSANDLVSVAITSGHNATTVNTLVNAALAGGVTSAVAAKLRVKNLLLTAVTAGTAGNSITLVLTAGATAGSEVVTVVSSAISVQIQDGVSSEGQVKDAIAASGAAAALIVGTSTGPALYTPPTYAALGNPGATSKNILKVADLSSPTNLTGGVAPAAAAVTVQGITITSSTNDATQNGATFSATPGVTAGAEVVTVTGNNVSIQIQNGVSTITQVVTALMAAGAFTALYAATGSGSTAIFTVDPTLVGQSGLSFPGTYGFYTDQSSTTLTTTYQYLNFGNVMGEITFNNDDQTGTNKLSFSWDGTNVHGILSATQAMSFEECNKSGVYVKYVTGSPAFRITTTAQ